MNSDCTAKAKFCYIGFSLTDLIGDLIQAHENQMDLNMPYINFLQLAHVLLAR